MNKYKLTYVVDKSKEKFLDERGVFFFYDAA